MNRHKLTDIGHRRLPFANPIGETKIERLLELLPLRPGHRVLDIGAGKGEFLRRVVRRRGVHATGVEIRGDIAPRSRGRLRMVIEDAVKYVPPRPFDVAACIGSTHALGGYLPTLKALKKWVTPGGFIAVGEGFWMKRPATGYLKALKSDSSEFTTHAGNLARAEALGLLPMWSVTATQDEWDEYEWTYSSSIETYAADHPDDPDSKPMLDHIRAWRRARLKWGRDTLGFGLYLFRNGPSR
ncbi:MAG TPA: class I SAM-dependent methyltransferase [Planctomycetota bacterium]|nr:class I SAM-dependent methyltransferase [Planctomycetota bacterium]